MWKNQSSAEGDWPNGSAITLSDKFILDNVPNNPVDSKSRVLAHIVPEKQKQKMLEELKITAAVVASSSFISFPFDGATRLKWAIYWKVDSKFIFKHLYCVLTATISSVKLTGQTLNTSANGFECFRITTCHLLKNENKTARRRKWENEKIQSATQNRNVQKHASEYRVCIVLMPPMPPSYHIQHTEHS